MRIFGYFAAAAFAGATAFAHPAETRAQSDAVRTASEDATALFGHLCVSTRGNVQRINRARIASEREGRKIADGEVRTACQQACPSHAIVFGDLANPDSAVAKAKRDPRDYGLLTELGTRPRTTYLAIVRNPNPELVG